MIKKIALLIIFVFSLNLLSAQNWKLITKTDKYNYVKGSLYYTIWSDSSTIENGDSVFFMNRVIKKVKNGDNIGPSYVKGYYLENQPQFFLSKIISTASGDILMRENDSLEFTLKPFAKLNDKWVFNNLRNDTAVVVEEQVKSIFGTNDSIKVVVLNNTKDTVILSKQFGILKFPVYDSVHQHVNLVGIEGRNVGLILPKFKDIFDFKIGDIFYYDVTYSDRFNKNVLKKKITIKKREELFTGVKYTVSYTSRHIRNSINPMRLDTIYSIVPDSLITFIDSINGLANKYTNQTLNNKVVGEDKKNVNVYKMNSYGVVGKSVPYDNFCGKLGDTIVETALPHGCEEARTIIYGNGIGLISRKYSRYNYSPYPVIEDEVLTGCIKDGKLIGVVPNDSIFLSTAKFKNERSYVVYPNPASSTVIIESKLNVGKVRLSVFNIAGLELKTQEFQADKINVDISTFDSGVYIMKLIGDTTIEVVKIIKE